jgi:aminotransferase EvaB
MNNPEIPVYDSKSQLSVYEDEYLDLAADVIKSGIYINGERTALLKAELSEFLGGMSVHLVASGTDALIIGMRSLGLDENSIVVTVANAGGYVSIAGMQIGCKMIFCDIDSTTHLISLESLREIVNENTQALVITHLYGNMVDMNEVYKICSEFEIKIIEDYAQAFGGNSLVPFEKTSTSLFTFSFYPTKNLAGIGDAGAIASHDTAIMEKVKKISQYGWTKKYEIDLPKGINSRMDEIQAGIISINLKRLAYFNQLRREIISGYKYLLSESEIKFVTKNSINDVAHLCIIKIPKEIDRNQLIYNANESGISFAIHYPRLDIDQPGLTGYFKPHSIPVSQRENKLILTIPLFPFMNKSQTSRVCDFLLKQNQLKNGA